MVLLSKLTNFPYSYTILTKQEGIFIVEKFVLETAVKYRNIGIKVILLSLIE